MPEEFSGPSDEELHWQPAFDPLPQLEPPRFGALDLASTVEILARMQTELDLKDVRILDTLTRSPDWKIPADAYKHLPALLVAFIARNQEKFLEGKMTRDVMRAIEVLRRMDAGNKSRETPPIQEVSVKIDRSVDQAIGELEEANLTDAELEAVAAVGPILDRLGRMRAAEAN